MNWNESLFELLTALGIGLLIGTVRERLHKPGAMKAGVRTHAIVALLGAISFSIGLPLFLMALFITGIMIAIGYYQSAQQDPGMTGEFALLLTLVLSGLSMQDPSLSAAIGVVVACLLFVKKPLRRFSQEILTEQELEDALMLCASALVVLPLLYMPPCHETESALGPDPTTTTWKLLSVVVQPPPAASCVALHYRSDGTAGSTTAISTRCSGCPCNSTAGPGFTCAILQGAPSTAIPSW